MSVSEYLLSQRFCKVYVESFSFISAQSRSQGLIFPSGAREEDGKLRDPGNEVGQYLALTKR